MQGLGMSKRLLRLVLVIAILAVTIGCDQATKVAARTSLQGSGVHRIVGNVLLLVYVENTGGFLSFGSTWKPAVRTVIFSVLSAIILGALLIYTLRSRQMGMATTIALCLLAGGGIGNILDRLLRDGRVADFINLGLGSVRTGIFNFADLSIMTGLAMIAIIGIAQRKRV